MAKKEENYLDYIPKHNILYEYSTNADNRIEIKVHNKGLFHKIAQLFFKRPKTSNIELDEFGSFVWNCIDGKASVFEIGAQVKEQFGEKAEPLYQRLSQFIKILHDNGFVVYLNKLSEKQLRKVVLQEEAVK